MSWTQAGISGSAIAGIPLLTAIAALWGWRAAFVGLAGLVLMILLVAGRAVRPDPPPRTRSVNLRHLLAAYAPLLHHPPTLAVIGGSLFGSASFQLMVTYVGAFYMQLHDLTTAAVGWTYTLGGLAFLAGTLVGGRLGDWAPRPLLAGTRLGAGLLVALALGMPLATPLVISLISLSALLTGVNSVITAVVLTSESPGGRATTMTVNGSAYSLGIAIGGAFGGLLLVLGSYPALGLGSLGLAVVAGGLVWGVRERTAVGALPAVLPPATER